ncbi:hypothetical protein J5N97_024403 [Dioscorea zingiberensis]|uniref:Uncharacterized protein n=1 Tax=Dioscorea zingiberensis TaxID=325984 RepID=A0A9D5H8Q4_9LILI|nr:hypothetical protein J5N97_024403 [Dioscorea zingiberensis]
MESTGNIEALMTTLVMNCGVTGGEFPNHPMFKFTILCLVAMFSCSLTARKLEVGYQAASRFFHGLTTVFGAIIVAILSGILIWGKLHGSSCGCCAYYSVFEGQALFSIFTLLCLTFFN